MTNTFKKFYPYSFDGHFPKNFLTFTIEDSNNQICLLGSLKMEGNIILLPSGKIDVYENLSNFVKIEIIHNFFNINGPMNELVSNFTLYIMGNWDNFVDVLLDDKTTIII